MNKKNFYYTFSLIIIFFLIGGVTLWNSIIRRNVNIDAGEGNEIYLMHDYVVSGKIYSGGTFNSSKFQDINQLHDNIFSFFELPANKNGELVPLKGWGRLILKFPIFLNSSLIFFWGVWKIIGMILTLGFFLFILRDFSNKRKIVFILSALVFLPEFCFELEFSSLFIAIASLYLFFRYSNRNFLFLYFIFLLYASILRNEFLIFGSIANLYILIYMFYYKRYSVVFILIPFYILFISSLLIGNYYYYGGFLTFGYIIETSAKATGVQAGEAVVASSSILKSFIDRFSGLVFPDFSIINTYNNLLYVLHNKIGFYILVLLIFHFVDYKKSRYFPPFFYLFLLFLIVWGFLYYGSNPWNYKPINPLESSYIRYFSVIILLLWLLFYKNVLPLKTISVSFFCFYFLLSMSDDLLLQYKRMLRIDKNIQIILNIPDKTAIFPASRIAEMFYLKKEYYPMQPSGEDNFYVRIMSKGLVSEHPFFEKVYSYIENTKKPVYVYSSNKGIIDFFTKRGLKIINHGVFSEVSN